MLLMEVLDGDFLERLNKYRGAFLYVLFCKASYLRNIIFLEVNMGVPCFAE